MIDIQTLAINFRKAIDAAHVDGHFAWKYDSYHMDRMWRFPHDCCDDTCDLFWHYLLDNYGIALQQISCYYPKEGTRHNWLETDDGRIIDLTGDQFKGRPPVYVDAPDRFYCQMEDRRVVDLYCILNDDRLKRDYDVIMEYMEKMLPK